MRVQHNTPPQAQGARDADESRDTHGGQAARNPNDETSELPEGERGRGTGMAPSVPTLVTAQRFVHSARAELPSQEARELENILHRARTLSSEPHKRMRMENEESADESEPVLDEEGRSRVLQRYLVEKAKLRAGLRAREQWLSQIQALRREEGELAKACRATLDQLLERSLGEEYAATMLSPPASPK
ncbi:hypothetical protein MOBT1_000631 [Malassezia obtusa]|uniref:Uncharacterized protein n=1 Tax=Malassezia obtusa TaxID=76774 RepID=A0AAF0DYK1_9BASI|nr:hypothetical protein MOBT1_000631 [Malassezia obtusa]